MQNGPEEYDIYEGESVRDPELEEAEIIKTDISIFQPIGYAVIILSITFGIMFHLFWLHGLFYGFILIGIGQIKQKLEELLNKK